MAVLVEDLGADVVWSPADCSEMRKLSKDQNLASPNSPLLLLAQSGGEAEVSNQILTALLWVRKRLS